jgi:hypothetical protein
MTRNDNILDLDALPRSKDDIEMGEFFKRLKDPKDKFIQKKWLELKNQIGNFADKAKPVVDEIMNTPAITLLAAKKLTLPENISRITVVNGIDILRKIPKTGGKDKTRRKIAKLFLNNLKIDKFKILKCIPLHTKTPYERLDFNYDPRRFDAKLRNRFRGLRTITKDLGYKYKFSKYYIEIVPIKKMP